MAHFIIALDTFNESRFAQLILNNYQSSVPDQRAIQLDLSFSHSKSA